MTNYYAWLDNGKNIIIIPSSSIIPTGDPGEYELETSIPYIDKEATLLKLYGNGTAPIFKKEIDNKDLNPNLHKDGNKIIFDKPSVGGPYYDLYYNLYKVLKTPKFIKIRAKKSTKPKPKRKLIKKCKCK